MPDQRTAPPTTAHDHPDLAAIVSSGLLDLPFYVRCSPDLQISDVEPLGHFCHYGDAEGRRPNEWFDPAHYRGQVRAAAAAPLLHYVREGENAGHRPHAYFDPVWYARAYDVPSGASPLRHFLDHRFIAPHAPCAELHAITRTQAYARDIALRIDPFLRAVDEANAAGRDPSPDAALVDGSGLFDLNYYLINGSDVHSAKLDPIGHFCRFGWREGRKPNIYFDTRWYASTNAEVLRRDVNPLLHYIQIGEAAGRRPIVYFDPAWYRVTYGIAVGQSPLAHFMVHRRSQKFSPNADFDLDFYLRAHGEKVGANRDPFAHFLQTGTYQDVDPSGTFSSADYRRTKLGRPSKHFRHRMHPDQDNPLVHSLHARYV